jgi:hypothetical protein
MVDVDQFDVFDLDAFGNPFECLYIIVNRLKWSRTDRVAVFLTDGTAWNAKRNAQPKGFMHWLGAEHRDKSQYRMRDPFIKTAIIKAAEICGAELGQVQAIMKTAGCAMRYIGYVMHKSPISQISAEKNETENGGISVSEETSQKPLISANVSEITDPKELIYK